LILADREPLPISSAIPIRGAQALFTYARSFPSQENRAGIAIRGTQPLPSRRAGKLTALGELFIRFFHISVPQFQYNPSKLHNLNISQSHNHEISKNGL
jgi:hypothetical protein